MKKILILIIIILLHLNVFLGYKLKTEVFDYSFNPPKFAPPIIHYDIETLYRYDKYIKFVHSKENKKFVKYLNYKDIDTINILDNQELFLLVFKDRAGVEYPLIYKNRLEVLVIKYLIKKKLNEGEFVVDINKYDFNKDVRDTVLLIKKGSIILNEQMLDTNIENLISNELKKNK